MIPSEAEVRKIVEDVELRIHILRTSNPDHPLAELFERVLECVVLQAAEIVRLNRETTDER